MDMNRETNILASFFNQTLTQDLATCRSDVGTISCMMKRRSGVQHNKTHIYQKGSGGKEIIDAASKYVVTQIKSASQIEDMDNLQDKVDTFKEHIQTVIDEIQQLSDSTDNLGMIAEVRSKYESFSQHINKILTAKGYRFVSDNGLNMMMKETSSLKDGTRLWSTLYNIWLPFITNIDQIIKSSDPDSDDAIRTYQIITDQLHTIMNTFDMFEQLIDELIKKYDALLQKPAMKTYQLDRSVQSPATDSEIHYICLTSNTKPDLAPETGSIIFTKEKIYNFMKDVDLSTPDAFSLVETQKMRFIDQYVQKLNKTSGFMSAVGLEINNDKNIISANILARFKEIEQFSGQVGGDGEIVEYDSRDLSQLLLNMTDRIKLINIKLKSFKKMVKDHEIEQNRIKFYIFYVMNTASLRGVKRLNMYHYINRGIMDFYRNILNDIDARRNRDDMPIDAIYFDTYHGLLITRIKTFLQFLISNMNIDYLIDIGACTGPIVSDFILFNHFKDVLDSYYETIQNNVSIYARLNDFPSKTLPDVPKRLFVKDQAHPQNVIANYKNCLTTVTGASRRGEFSDELWDSINRTDPKSSKFNMVFDYEEFNRNEDIAMYMSISTNISKKKSVTLITYGYSGTGKTYTLFGNGENKGLLQSAIEGILSKKEIYFRTYEIYGAGVKYPFYWCESVSEKCYVYRINPITYKIDTVFDTDVDKIISNSGIDSNSRSEFPGYTKIDSHRVKGFFQNFNNLVDQIDGIRIEQGRIKATPNNPVSSRSIIIYDMMIRVDDELVRLVVIDLPGREEIVQTYTRDYIEKPKNRRLNTPFHKAVLSSMSIDPLYLAILCPVLIVKAFNNLDPDIRRYIMEQGLTLDDLGDCLNKRNKCLPKYRNTKTPIKSDRYIPPLAEPIPDLDLEPESQKVNFMDETVLYMLNGSTRKMSQIIDVDRDPRTGASSYMITLVPNTRYVPDQENISNRDSIFIDFDKSGWSNSKHVNKSGTTVQYQAVVAIHLLNRILLLKDTQIPVADKRRGIKMYSKFDVLEAIYQTIAETFGYEDYDKMFRSPFEGVYINENIVGMLKVLSTDKTMLNKSVDEAMKMISPQEDTSFKETKRIIRESNIQLYKEPFSVKDTDDVETFEHVVIDKSILNSIYVRNSTSYSSQKIFLFCEPLIERVIKYYITDTTIPVDDEETGVSTPLKVSGSRDVKIFYLFSNVNQDLKCVHQYKLFENTTGLMQLIDSSNV